MRLICNNKNFIQEYRRCLPARLFTFNSISTRYSVITLVIISKLPVPILTSSLNDICSFYRVARDARGMVHLVESAQSRLSIARAGVHYRRPAASHLRSSLPPQYLCVLRRCNDVPDTYCCNRSAATSLVSRHRNRVRPTIY